MFPTLIKEQKSARKNTLILLQRVIALNLNYKDKMLVKPIQFF